MNRLRRDDRAMILWICNVKAKDEVSSDSLLTTLGIQDLDVMLHTKLSRNRPAGSGEEDFLRVFTIYGRGGHLGHVTSIMSSDFHFHVPESFHTKFWSDRHKSF